MGIVAINFVKCPNEQLYKIQQIQHCVNGKPDWSEATDLLFAEGTAC